MDSNQERYCFLNDDRNSVALALKADEFIVAGADFNLFDPATQEVIETWKATIDKGNASVHRLKTKAGQLSKMKLAWQIVCCSSKSNVYEGSVILAVTQGNTPLKPSKPLRYNITNIPPCGLDSTENFKGSMVFIHNKGEQFVE